VSLDITIRSAPCAHCGHGAESFQWNCTYNVSPMVHAAAMTAGLTEEEYPGGSLLAGIEGRAGDYAPRLARIIAALDADPERFRAMDAPNGWGTYDNLVPALRELLAALQERADWTVTTWR